MYPNLLALCKGNPPVTHKGPVALSFYFSFISDWTKFWSNSQVVSDFRWHGINLTWMKSFPKYVFLKNQYSFSFTVTYLLFSKQVHTNGVRVILAPTLWNWAPSCLWTTVSNFKLSIERLIYRSVSVWQNWLYHDLLLNGKHCTVSRPRMHMMVFPKLSLSLYIKYCIMTDCLYTCT